jgi:hypothetical protein
MLTHTTSATKIVGFWSAVLATGLSLTYVVAQLAEWAGWLGSAGGPESSSTPLGILLLLTPSILLGSSFLVLMASVHQAAPPEGKVWSQTALAFATVYAVLISMTYFVQLTLVGPRIAEGRTEGIELLLFVPFDSFLYSVDLLGYSFMSAATLFAAPVFEPRGLERTARWLLIANGLLIPFLIGQLFYNPLIWPAAAWAITFPGATWAVALVFLRTQIGEPATASAGPGASPASPEWRTAER